MSKQYNRKRTQLPFVQVFECKKCGDEFSNKSKFKQHWHEAHAEERVKV